MTDKMTTWLKALRSGEYTQAEGTLVKGHYDTGYSYCCLGVAKKVVFNAEPAHLHHEVDLFDEEAHKLGLDAYVTAEEADILFEKYDVSVQPGEDTRQHTCINANDKTHLTFNEIADMVEHMGWDKVEVTNA